MLGPDFISDHITVSAGPVIANVCGSLVLPFHCCNPLVLNNNNNNNNNNNYTIN